MSCYYCPLSEKKKGKDVVYANERRSSPMRTSLKRPEHRRGGHGHHRRRPAVRPGPDAALHRLLKTEFGPGHHIHLYTSTVDGISSGPWSRRDWTSSGSTPVETGKAGGAGDRGGGQGPGHPCRIRGAGDTGGGEGLARLIDFADRTGLDFVNLNELEFSETNAEALQDEGLRRSRMTSPAPSRAVRSMAKRLIRKDLGSGPLLLLQLQGPGAAAEPDQEEGAPGREAHDLVTEEGMLLKGIDRERRTRSAAAGAAAGEYDVPLTMMKRRCGEEPAGGGALGPRGAVSGT